MTYDPMAIHQLIKRKLEMEEKDKMLPKKYQEWRDALDPEFVNPWSEHKELDKELAQKERQIIELCDALEKAVEALRFYGAGNEWDYGEKAREILKELCGEEN